MKKDILIDFLDEHIEFKASFDEIKDQIMIPSVVKQKKSSSWVKILVPALTCLFVAILGIGVFVGKSLDRKEMTPPNDGIPSVDVSECGLTPYKGDVQSVLKKQYELAQGTKKQTILNYLEDDRVIYELSYKNGLIPESYIIAYMSMESYHTLKNKKMDGSIINELISQNSSLTELKWFTCSSNTDIKILQSSYHLAAIYAVGKVEIINSDQQILNQLSYLKPLNIPMDSQIVQLNGMKMNLSNYWFMTQTATDVTAWNGHLGDYVISNMMIAEIQNSIVEFDYNEDDLTTDASNQFLKYLEEFHIEQTKYNYEGLLKYIENYKEGKVQ